MNTTSNTIPGAGAAMLLVAVIAAGCAMSRATTEAPADKGGITPTAPQTSDLSGSQLWGQMCGLCHNAPSPKDYNDANWEVAVMHMRVQARLTGEEERKIVQFLKASN